VEVEMKLARIEYQGNVAFGRLEGDEVALLHGSPLEAGRETGVRYALRDVRFLPPVTPTKIVCIGLNYREHIEEIGAKVPEEPHFFLKPPSSLIGHEDSIVIPRKAERVDYEGELAVVVKEQMKDVPEAESMKHILGCSCFNDVTERAIVSRSIADLTLAKGFDTFGAFGPYVVTDLEPDDLDVRTYLNGELMQEDNTSHCVFALSYILHYLSQCMTLYPGDIVVTGTPKGIAPMKPGDVVEVEVSGVGKLRNPVRAQGPV
jgi:2-keto-4-pentenoate hydratase/2-oxohepta-3-ene-1,7-dioic acid hydratase in catechol pathway